MKAVKSEKLKEIINLPENKDKFRQFLVVRSSASGRFNTTSGTSTTVKFVDEKTSKTAASKKR